MEARGRCNLIGLLSFGEFNFLLFLFSRGSFF